MLEGNTQVLRVEKSYSEEFNTEKWQNDLVILTKQVIKQEENIESSAK